MEKISATSLVGGERIVGAMEIQSYASTHFVMTFSLKPHVCTSNTCCSSLGSGLVAVAQLQSSLAGWGCGFHPSVPGNFCMKQSPFRQHLVLSIVWSLGGVSLYFEIVCANRIMIHHMQFALQQNLFDNIEMAMNF